MDNLSKPKVLVVDPDPSIRALVAAVVRREGYAADVAENADAALNRCRESQHAAVVVDPRILGGEALIDALQREAPDVESKVIVMTSTDGAEPRYAHAAGVRAVLIKPFLIDDLATVIASCCQVTN